MNPEFADGRFESFSEFMATDFLIAVEVNMSKRMLWRPSGGDPSLNSIVSIAPLSSRSSLA